MRYLLDTCVISDFVKGSANVVARLKLTAPGDIAISSITRMEIEFGLALNPERAKKLQPLLGALFDSITTIGFNVPEARAAAGIRAALQQKGRPVGAYDSLIAGTGLVHGMIVVTSNTGEFSRIAGLHIEDWRIGKH